MIACEFGVPFAHSKLWLLNIISHSSEIPKVILSGSKVQNQIFLHLIKFLKLARAENMDLCIGLEAIIVCFNGPCVKACVLVDGWYF